MKLSRTKMLGWCATFGIVGALALMPLSGCSPSDSPSKSDSTAKQSPVPVAFSMNVECGACHADEQSSSSNSSCLASKHVEKATCTTCHDDEGKLTKAHEGKAADSKMPTKLKRTAVTSEACLSCHNSEDRVAKTASSVVCTDSEGTTVNPHNLPINADHAKIVCSDCHEEHTAVSANESALEECLSCHHANVYKCHTCHD